jgi:hypothetical protein
MVSKDAVLNSPYVWKANLIGGGRLGQLLERLSRVRTLDEFLEEKMNHGWEKGEGFIETGDKNLADYITDKDFLPTEFFTEKGIELTSLPKCDIKCFHRPRKKELYTPPHLLIRKILGKNKLITQYSDKYMTFLSDIYSIHAPQEQKHELIEIADYLKESDNLLRFFILATSSRVKILKATSLYDEDILSIPYPKDLNDITLSKADEVILNDSMTYFLNSNSKHILEEETTENEIYIFSDVFCKTLNSIYLKEKSFQLFKIIDAGKYYALHFEYTSEKLNAKHENAGDIEKYIEAAIPSRKENRESSHIQKIIKAYGQDSIILAKPKQLRYWLPSIALRDADETFADYVKSRYYNA